jgi:outer membrane protein assembly factor BamB
MTSMSGCSTIGSAIDALNPFKSEPKVKMAELDTIKPTAELKRLWQTSVGAAGDYVFTPAVVGASVYAAGADGTIVRIDEGREVWRIKAGQKLSGGVGAGDSLVVVGTPKGEVLAFAAADGKPAWQARVGSEVLSAPSLGADAVIVRSGDNRIYALDPADGKRRWIYQRGTPALSLRSNTGVTLTANAILAGFPGGKLVAINPGNGAATWEGTVALPRGATELERMADVTSNPATDGRVVCSVAYQGRIACFDLGSGNGLWAREMSSSVGLALDGRYMYVTDEKGAVHAFDGTSGASVWKQDKLFMRGVSRPVPVGEYVLVGDVRGVVHLLRREDGAFAARFTTDDSAINGDPQPSARGVIVQTKNGGVFALTP